MAQPSYVPRAPIDRTRVYRAPLRQRGPWTADRPGELGPGQPRGERFGNQGPDQGYALTLAERFRDRLTLRPGEHADDALVGAVAVGLKRASLLGRAPVSHDVEAGLTVFGFLDADPADELVARRRTLFAEAAEHHRHEALRAIADAVPAEVLVGTIDAIRSAHPADWQALLD